MRPARPQGMSLDLLLSAATHPKESLFGGISVSDRSDLGTQPLYRYKLWLHERLAGPVTTMVLIMLTVALVQPFESRTGAHLLAIWLAAGFVAWTFDGLGAAFGDIGLLPPTLAAWTPPMVFAVVAVWLMLHDERRKVRRDPSAGARLREWSSMHHRKARPAEAATHRPLGARPAASRPARMWPSSWATCTAAACSA